MAIWYRQKQLRKESNIAKTLWQTGSVFRCRLRYTKRQHDGKLRYPSLLGRKFPVDTRTKHRYHLCPT